MRVSLPNNRTWRFVYCCVLVSAVTFSLPTMALARCSAAQQADLAAARAAKLRIGATKPIARDLNALTARASKRCIATPFVRAVAEASSRWGQPVVGRRYVRRGYELVGTRVGATVVYRLDLTRQALQVRTARTVAARNAARTRLLSSAWLTSVRATWSNDPTRATWDTTAHISVGEQLVLIPTAIDRSLAARTIANITGSRQRSITTAPLFTALALQTRMSAAAARSRSRLAINVSQQVANSVQGRARRSVATNWSRIDGSWATIYQHRALIRSLTASIRFAPSNATSATIAELQSQLIRTPRILFRIIPAAAFYPAPIDGVRDKISATVNVDTPGTLQMTVFGPGDATTLVSSTSQRVVPGNVEMSWLGTTTAGAPATPGVYRYALTLRSVAGTSLPLPGLGHMTLAHDTLAPVVKEASVKWVRGSSVRVLQARWIVHEFLSPNVRVTMTIRGNGVSRDIVVSNSARRGVKNVSTKLKPGNYRFGLVFVDGAGNRAGRYLGTSKVA